MYFDLTDEQAAIQAAARDFLSSRYQSERVRELIEGDGASDAEAWRELSELGWPGLTVPERWGGEGLGIVELAVLFEEMGYSLAPSPLFATTVVALALAHCGSDAQRERWLAPLARGELRGAPALWDAGSPATPGTFTLFARPEGDGVVLDGEKVLVPAADADFFLVADAAGRRHVVARDAAGLSVSEEPSLDLTRPLSSLRLEGVRVAAEDTLPAAAEDYYPVFFRLCVALAAESTGVARRALEMSVAYAGDRQQFGRPIGAYQAVSHRCAQMLLETENARSAVYGAAWAADAEPESLPLAASMAKAYASDAGWRVPDAAIQVHGGIGFTWEHDLHLLLKRGRANAALFGDARWHREQVARAILEAA